MKGFGVAVLLAIVEVSKAFAPIKPLVSRHLIAASTKVSLTPSDDFDDFTFDEDDAMLAYEDWLDTYDKEYDEERFEIFKKNYLSLMAHNLDSGSNLSLNAYADRTPEEFARQRKSDYFKRQLAGAKKGGPFLVFNESFGRPGVNEDGSQSTIPSRPAQEAVLMGQIANSGREKLTREEEVDKRLKMAKRRTSSMLAQKERKKANSEQQDLQRTQAKVILEEEKEKKRFEAAKNRIALERDGVATYARKERARAAEEERRLVAAQKKLALQLEDARKRSQKEEERIDSEFSRLDEELEAEVEANKTKMDSLEAEQARIDKAVNELRDRALEAQNEEEEQYFRRRDQAQKRRAEEEAERAVEEEVARMAEEERERLEVSNLGSNTAGNEPDQIIETQMAEDEESRLRVAEEARVAAEAEVRRLSEEAAKYRRAAEEAKQKAENEERRRISAEQARKAAESGTERKPLGMRAKDTTNAKKKSEGMENPNRSSSFGGDVVDIS